MKTMQKTREKTRKLVVAGMLSAVTMVLGLTPLGIIPIGPLNATILHVPVIIGAVLEGPVVGFVIGLIFGLFSLYRAAVGGSVLAPLFLNPVVTILPRVLIGPVAYYVFRGISHLTRKRALSVGAAAVAGTLTNTIGVMGLIFILYAQQYADLMGISRQGVHDLVKRCQKTLEGYESKLHLVEKFLSVKEKVGQIDKILEECENGEKKPEEIVKSIRQISDAIIEEL